MKYRIKQAITDHGVLFSIWDVRRRAVLAFCSSLHGAQKLARVLGMADGDEIGSWR